MVPEKSNWTVKTVCNVGDPMTNGSQPVNCSITIDHGEMKVHVEHGRHGFVIGISMEDVRRTMEEYSHS